VLLVCLKSTNSSFNSNHEHSLKVACLNRTPSTIQPKPEPPSTNMIYSCTFNTDGTLIFVVISEILAVYSAESGELVTKPTKAGIHSLI